MTKSDSDAQVASSGKGKRTDSAIRRRSSHKAESTGSAQKETAVDAPAKPQNDDPAAEPQKPEAKGGSKSIFKPRTSLLSSESSETVSYRGFLNVSLLVLFLANFRLIISNFMKYGILLTPSAILDFLEDPTSWPGLFIIVVTLPTAAFSFFIEYTARHRMLSRTLTNAMNGINLLICLLLPIILIYFMKPNPISAFLAVAATTVLWLKLTSYALINTELRYALDKSLKKKGKGAEVEVTKSESIVCYPDNINVKDLLYFLAAPTLVYDLNYPRNDRIRWAFVARRAIELFVVVALQYIIIEQYMVVTVKNSIEPMTNLDWWWMTERLLKLAIPNLYVWLLGFYGIFHLYLNIIAELLRFADREFYRDWWQASYTDYFWRTWNIPVHTWMTRHILYPAVYFKMSRNAIFWIVFFISAVFHEILVSVPFQTFKLWAFFGMMAQVPLSHLTRPLKNTSVGNIIFWITIILGQPLCILAYALDYYERSLVAST